MKKNYLLTLVLGLFFSPLFSQFSENDVQFWVGAGPDTAVLVVDFNDGSTNTAYAWGFLFDENDNLDMGQLLDSIQEADNNFQINTAGGFLNDINYLSHTGVGGTNNFYWATYSGSNFASLSLNAGLTEVITNGTWFACSFTDWDVNPPYDPLQSVSDPIAAINPTANLKSTTANDINIMNDAGTITISGLNGVLMLTDMTGRLVYRAPHLQTSQILKNSLPDKQLYILSIQTDKLIISKKIYF